MFWMGIGIVKEFVNARLNYVVVLLAMDLVACFCISKICYRKMFSFLDIRKCKVFHHSRLMLSVLVLSLKWVIYAGEPMRELKALLSLITKLWDNWRGELK
ncbi:hypothetical protein Dimus_003559 [Dionaea muscipula]